MKFYLQPIIRMGAIALIAGALCLGCAGMGEKFEQWQQTLSNQFKSDDSQSAAGDAEQTADADQRAEYFQHTCRWTGETLPDVALWYTKDVKNWKKLAAANTDVDPKKIALGSQIRIPVNLLKTRKPLPKSAVGWNRRQYFHHRVRWAGESLSLISRWYTGSTRNWRKLADANPAMRPNRIRTGDIILIPPGLLKTRKPMPRKVAARYTPQYFAYTVKHDGEKLTDIASWYTGNRGNWQALAKANPELDSNSLSAGNEIYIPPGLLKTRKPISLAKPEKLPAKIDGKSRTSAARKSPPPEAPVKLFGLKRVPKS